jgi:hypothetical protein
VSEKLSEPMTGAERDYRFICNEPLHRLKIEDVIDMYEEYRVAYETSQFGPREMSMAKKIIDILYCELLERDQEFDYE